MKAGLAERDQKRKALLIQRGDRRVDVATITKPLVSAIVPTRNRACLLPKALDSIYAQEGVGTLFDLEVIVVDDASSDATARVMQDYPEARYVRLPARRGVSAARNAGIAASAGQFVAFLDDDDEWLPRRLAIQVPVLVRHPEAGAVYSEVPMPAHAEAATPDRTGDVARDATGGSSPSGCIFDALLDRCFMAVSAVLVRREALEQVGYFDESLTNYEDWDLWLRISLCFPFLFVPGIVAIYNPSPTGLWLTGAANGSGANAAALVLRRALRAVPGPAGSGEATRQAASRGAAANRWTRAYITRLACRRILAAGSPLSAGHELCRQIRSAVPQRGIRERWKVRLTIAEIWLQMARASAFGHPPNKRIAIVAAARAAAEAPSLGVLRAAAGVVFHAVLARNAEGANRQRDGRLARCLTWAVVVAIALSAFWRLGNGSLHDWDEAIYAQVSREMVATADWLRPHYEYHLWIDKPPLLMWSTAVLFKVFGVSEFWARAASALAGGGVVVLTFLIAAWAFDRWTGLAAIAILMTSFDFVKYERRGMTDVPLTLFVLIALYGYMRLRDGEPRRWYAICSACALAVMIKSIAALVAPAAMLLASANDARGVGRLLRSRHLVVALAVAALIALPWHVFMFAAYGADFVRRYFGFQVGHALSVVQGNAGDRWYYLEALGRGMAPWTFLLPVALWLGVSDHLRTRHRSLVVLALVAVIFAVYQFSRTKLPYYIVPAYPPLAILTGRLVAVALRVPRPLTLAAVMAGAIVAALRAQHLVLGGLVACAIAALAFLIVRRTINPRLGAAAAFAVLLVMGLRGVEPLYREGVSPVAALASQAASRNSADRAPLIVFSGLPRPAALFYSGRPIVKARSWADIARVAGRTPRRIILARRDLDAIPPEYAIRVQSNAGDFVYAWIWTTGGTVSPGPGSSGTR